MSTDLEGGQGPLTALLNRPDFLADFTGHVVGFVDDPVDDIAGLVGDLLASGLPTDDIHLYAGPEGEIALDLSGARHGRIARLRRAVQSVVYDGELQRAQHELEAGHAVVCVDVSDDDGAGVAALLRRHHAHDLVHYGRFTWERLGSAA